MKSDVLETIRIVFVMGLCAFVFGCAWAFVAPGGWGFYGAVIATVGFCAILIAVLVKIFIVEDSEPPIRYIHLEKRPSPYELERLQEVWWRRHGYVGISTSLADDSTTCEDTD